MNSPEEIQKIALAAEMAGVEKMPEAPETATNFESIERYAENAEISIDSQANDFAGENKAIENPDTFGLPDAAAREIRVEQKVDDELGKIESEADKVVKTAKTEIEAIVHEPDGQLEKQVESKEVAPKYVDDDPRYKAIEKEFSDMQVNKMLKMIKQRDSRMTDSDAEWELEHSSLGVSKGADGRLKANFYPSKIHDEFQKQFPQEYETYKQKEATRIYEHQSISNDPLYHGLEMRIGKLKPGGKGAAYDEFALTYPEKAEAYRHVDPDLDAALKRKEPLREGTTALNQPELNIEGKNDVAPEATTEHIDETPPHKLQKVFEQMGIESKTIPIAGNGGFAEAIILSKKEISTEKMVRLFRGVNHMDASLLKQTPYAMRTENSRFGKDGVIESVEPEVEALAHHPTYENLTKYIDKVKPMLSDAERRRMDDDLGSIEDGVLNGQSVRKELVFEQIKHGGAVFESGISPYVSASYDASEATAYIREGALVVMDVPISKIENFSSDSSETRIKGQPDQKYITAILPRKFVNNPDREKVKQDVEGALAAIAGSAPVPEMSESEMRAAREHGLAEEQKQDTEQWRIDVERVRRKRAEALVRKFPEVKIDLLPSGETSNESSVDVYSKSKTDIFDYYADRMGKIGRGGRRVEDASFTDSTSSERKPFDREKITDVMLIKLREFVENLEDREAERARTR